MIKSQASRFESFFPCFKKRRRGQLQHVACLLKLLEMWLAHTLLWSVIHKISKAPTLWLILAIFRPFTDVFKSQSHCHAHKLHSMLVLPHHGLNLKKKSNCVSYFTIDPFFQVCFNVDKWQYKRGSWGVVSFKHEMAFCHGRHLSFFKAPEATSECLTESSGIFPAH